MRNGNAAGYLCNREVDVTHKSKCELNIAIVRTTYVNFSRHAM